MIRQKEKEYRVSGLNSKAIGEKKGHQIIGRKERNEDMKKESEKICPR